MINDSKNELADSFRLNELQEQIEREKSLTTQLNLELQARREELLERDKRLQAMINLELVFVVLLFFTNNGQCFVVVVFVLTATSPGFINIGFNIYNFYEFLS